ncbi:MAG TPA: aminotransferase class III-fold pyridoxal phosphate-dependent enzyme, partial [Solirubrobacteraceae bacterium]
FHGKTLGVRYSGGQRAQDDQLVPPWLRIASFPVCSTHDALTYSVCEDSGAEALTQLTQRSDLNDVGAVLVEPVLGTAGNIPPPRRFLAGLRALCDERGWLLIFDEMITGFGRSGKLFASEYFGVIPDVLVLGKGLGGGFPLSAVCASQELWERSVLAEPSATATSYGGNPIACAAGMATLEIVTAPRFLDDVGAVGAHLAQRLVELAEASPLVGWPRGLGLMLGFDLLDARTGDLATGQDCAAIFRACLDRGVLLAADTPRVRVSPPLTLTLAEADELAGVLFEVLA